MTSQLYCLFCDNPWAENRAAALEARMLLRINKETASASSFRVLKGKWRVYHLKSDKPVYEASFHNSSCNIWQTCKLRVIPWLPCGLQVSLLEPFSSHWKGFAPPFVVNDILIMVLEVQQWLEPFQKTSLQRGCCAQIKDTFDVDDSRRSYFSSLFPLNPGGIVPAGPTLADLRLDEDPKRGPQNFDKLFHRKAQLALAA